MKGKRTSGKKKFKKKIQNFFQFFFEFLCDRPFIMCMKTNCVNQELHWLLDPHLTVRGSCWFTGNRKHSITAFGYRPNRKKAKCMYWFTNVWGDDAIDDYEEESSDTNT